MNYMIFSIICSHSILIASVIACFRIKAVLKDYYPFIIMLWAGLLNETISLSLLYSGHSNTVNSNIFVLLEFLLILYQFYRWNYSRRIMYLVIALAGISVWMADNFLLNSIQQNNSVFRVFYSFVILLFSIDKINQLLVFENSNLKNNAMFLICITFIFYYVFKACVESFNMIHLGLSRRFLQELWMILNFVNLITNLLFALATLWIPTRQKFILRY